MSGVFPMGPDSPFLLGTPAPRGPALVADVSLADSAQPSGLRLPWFIC